MYEPESQSSADWRGYTSAPVGLHWIAVLHGSDEYMDLAEAAFNYHWGNLNVDDDVVVLDRSEIVSVRSAAATSLSAFNAAMANTSAASSYATLCANATAAGITGKQRPENVMWRWFQTCAADYAL